MSRVKAVCIAMQSHRNFSRHGARINSGVRICYYCTSSSVKAARTTWFNSISHSRCTLNSDRRISWKRLYSQEHIPLVASLRERGLVADVTDSKIDDVVEQTPITLYCGFDPTARSLHVGNLVALVTLIRFMERGHRATFVVGGATGRVGDPSGRSTERALLDQSVLDNNLDGIKSTIMQVCHNAAIELQQKPEDFVTRFRVVDNFDWYKDQNPIDFLAEVGSHFRVTSMLSKTSMKNRLESDIGLSFLELSYQILQAYDFLQLHDQYGCTMQIGGSDQWGNITAGCELIRKTRQTSAYGLTLPLVTTANGVKFGKSLGNAVWLNEDMSTSFDLYQFFLNTDDRDIDRYLKMFTFLPMNHIAKAIQEHEQKPELRAGQKLLASEVTRLVHGSAGLKRALDASQNLFSTSGVCTLSQEDLRIMARTTDSIILDKGSRDNVTILGIAVAAGLFSSKKEAKRIAQAGGFHVNDSVCKEDGPFELMYILGGEYTVLRRGKKRHVVVEWS